MSTGTEPAPDRLGPATAEARRPGPGRVVRVVVAAALIAVLLLATLAGFRNVLSDPMPAPAPATTPVITLDQRGAPWPAALVSGTVRLEGGCLLLDDAVAVFPAGTTWSGSDRAVHFADGTRWRVGDRVEGAGGALPSSSLEVTNLTERSVAAVSGCAADTGADEVVLAAP